MKRLLSFTLAAVLLLGCLGLSSCAEKTLESIDGMLPGDYLVDLLDRDVDAERYDVVEGMRIHAEVLFVPLYETSVERLYIYSYDGKDSSLIMPKETLEQLEANEFDNVVDEYDGDVWYVDGVCYIDGEQKEKYESSTSPIGKNDHIRTLIRLLDDQSENVVCYEDGGYRFVLELTDPEEMKMKIDCRREVYTVYVTAEGLIENILIECKTDGIVSSVTSFSLDYVYEGLSPIEPPDDADEYKEI